MKNIFNKKTNCNKQKKFYDILNKSKKSTSSKADYERIY